MIIPPMVDQLETEPASISAFLRFWRLASCPGVQASVFVATATEERDLKWRINQRGTP
jgi:hypothetical protein